MLTWHPLAGRSIDLTEVPIKITIGDTVITARLADNATAHDLAGQLPLTLAFKDFNQVERLRNFPDHCRWMEHRQETIQTLAISATTRPLVIWSSTTATSATGVESSGSDDSTPRSN